ncbi:hypothetical protein scyTo_0016673 [Scyliorhinus torazame]|uniref:Uncharacterized protein n=1 Tax=Scyliorhinus torazame TaxID=75743 RepID=A0A401PW66_SCYTO|nr:hypothetical protein [Scyliorhinus torazame]
MAFHWRIVHSSLGLFVFTTLACFPLSATKQSCFRKQDNFSSIPETWYNSNPHPTSGAILVLYHMVHTFLDMVQPNPFPTDLVKTFVNNKAEIEKNYEKVRRVRQAGSVCMFVSNEKVTGSLQDSGTLLRITSENLKTYFRAIQTEVTAITVASTVPINSVTGNLDNIGSSLGVAIRQKLGETVDPALNSAFQLAQDIDEINNRLLLINSTAARLLHQQEVLEQNLTAIRQNINNIFNNCSSECVNDQDLVKDLHLLSNFNKVPNMDTEIEAMNLIANMNLYSTVQMVR